MAARAALAAAALPSTAAQPYPPPMPNVPLFEPVRPGGDTTCARGADYTFYYRKGTVNKLVVEFEGGGACWSKATCSDLVDDAGLFACTKEVDTEWQSYYLNSNWTGIHDAKNWLRWGMCSDGRRTCSPFQDWHYVFIPYCTCDAHTGTKDHWYGLIGGTVHHRGHTNFMAVLEWMKSNVPVSPEVVTTTGCSAGSLGATANWPYLAKQYPKAQQYVFGDSYIGVLSAIQYIKGDAHWGMTLPPWLHPNGSPKYSPFTGCDLHKKAAEAYPNAKLGFYTSNEDEVQSMFYLLGGGLKSWTKVMRDHVDCIHKGVTNERTFIRKGSDHCMSENDGFFNVSTDGVLLAQWLTDIVNGKDVRNVDCADSGECSPDAVPSPDLSRFQNYSHNLPYHQCPQNMYRRKRA